MISKKFPEIYLILKTYLLVLSIFSLFRILLFFSQIDRVDFDSTSIITIVQSFIMGIRFDIVISGYILAIPAFFLVLLGFFNLHTNLVKKSFFYFIFILFSIAFLISTADIPYFNQFYSRFSVGAFKWIDTPAFVFSMIFQDYKNIIGIVLYFILIVIYFVLLKKVFTTSLRHEKSNIFVKIFISLSFLALIFLGIRGRIEKKSPIRIGTAYFCNNSFLNQLGLNPIFTLIRTSLDSLNDDNKVVKLMNEKLAIKNVQQYLNIDSTIGNSPIARKIIPDTISNNKPNIIIVIMESMSTAKMKRYGNNKNLTPFLDSLSHQSYYFDNIYTAGEHTFNGIFSTLFSFPALYQQHTMEPIRKYDGINSVLAKYDYSSTYFSTHDTQFDNMEGFMNGNNFENIVSQKNYPAKEVKTTLGVPDDFMFRFSIPYLNNLHKENRPFLVSFMTTSDHLPYYVPDYFKPKNKEKIDQVVEYADWSLNGFLKLCSKQEWYSNTIFVFIADHGVPLGAPYDISLDYHHTPLIIYSPTLLTEPKQFNDIGGQIDVFPTIMGLLNFPYINNTLGIDLLKEKRPFILINADDKVGVLDNEHLLILNSQQEDKLFLYKTKNTDNVISDNINKADKMKEYCYSNLQVFQYMISNNITNLEK